MKKKKVKMTMKMYEKTSMDKKADKSGKHGKEGSKKDTSADKKAMMKFEKTRKSVFGLK